MKSPLLSIVTGTRDRQFSFERMLRSVLRYTDVPFELVVSDASVNPIDTQCLPDGVRIISERPRLGCTKGYNIAFRSCMGEWVIWLNDDCEVTEGYASQAIRFMERHPQVGLGALPYSDPNHIGIQTNRCCFGMHYANFGILRAELGIEVGWFDEDLLMYGNDNSLAYRVLMAGKGVAPVPGVHIIHHSEKDANRIQNNDMDFRVAQAELLKAKYGPHLERMRAVHDDNRVVAV